MKKILFIAFFGVIALGGFPEQSKALSCMDPAGMVENYVADESYTIVTAVPKKNQEHVKEKANSQDPNMSYDSGYTAQFLEIKEAHKGTAPDQAWVYFERNGTWNYLCAGAPAELNSENLYILSEGSGLFDVKGVVGVYPIDSEIAKQTLKALKASDKDFGEPSVYETDKAYWLQQLHDQLNDMAFIVKVKLAEWNFWLKSV